MAISVVQAVGKSSGASAVSSLQLTGLTTTAGNLYVLAIACAASGTTITSVTDSASNTWAAAKSETSSSFMTTYIFTTTSSSPSAITSVTATVTGGSAGVVFEFYEVSGNSSNTAPSDVTAGTSGTGTVASSGATGTPANSADLAIGIASAAAFGAITDSGPTFTSGAGTNHTGTATPLTTMWMSTSTLVLSSATAQTFSTTFSTSAFSNWSACVVLIKATSGGGGATTTAGNLAILGVG